MIESGDNGKGGVEDDFQVSCLGIWMDGVGPYWERITANLVNLTGLRDVQKAD